MLHGEACAAPGPGTRLADTSGTRHGHDNAGVPRGDPGDRRVALCRGRRRRRRRHSVAQAGEALCGRGGGGRAGRRLVRVARARKEQVRGAAAIPPRGISAGPRHRIWGLLGWISDELRLAFSGRCGGSSPEGAPSSTMSRSRTPRCSSRRRASRPPARSSSRRAKRSTASSSSHSSG